MPKIVGPALRALLLTALMTGQAALAETAAPQAQAVSAARAVMDRFMITFNARDEAAWADTLLFPHIRVAAGSVVVHADRETFLASADLDAFAEANNWHHSAWDAVEVIQAGPGKVHFKVTFSRFNPAGERYVTYDSLYIVQQVEGRWGIRARSSFAP